MAVMALGAALASIASTSAPAQTFPERPPLTACTAAAPARGVSFSGTVLQVIDGRTLCVAAGPTPADWVRVRLTDAAADQTRGALMAAAFARSVVCLAASADEDGARGVCLADGRSVGEAARDPATVAQAAAWR
jgi:hypothetical protein